MNSFEINKIFAAIVVTIIIVVGINKVSDFIFDVENENVAAYKVEAPEGSIVQAKSEATIDLSSFLASGNVEHGEKVFKKCAACHSIADGGGNKIGPALWGVLGRKIGSFPDYKYSKAMAAYGKSWSFEEMNGFLIKPKDWIKGTKMSFAGLKNAKERAAVILYMNENTNNPLPLN